VEVSAHTARQNPTSVIPGPDPGPPAAE